MIHRKRHFHEEDQRACLPSTPWFASSSEGLVRARIGRVAGTERKMIRTPPNLRLKLSGCGARLVESGYRNVAGAVPIATISPPWSPSV